MSVEIQMLIFAALLGLGQLLVWDVFATAQRGLKWNMSSREAVVPPLTGIAGRTERAFKNFMETFPIFAVAAIAVVLMQKESSLSYWGTQLYFYSRVLYFLVYAAGIVGLRSFIWALSLLGIISVFVSLL